ncbi:MAG: ring-cleaving dioxygenase [Bacteroidota bacterium]
MTNRQGIHHITALAGKAQTNADFYVHTLGMRLVKKSVNQDDPGTYHLFYGNGEGSPGSGLTFFPWPMAKLGRPGTGEAVEVGLSVPEASFDYWKERLGEQSIEFREMERFGKRRLHFRDPDLIELELVSDNQVGSLPGWDGSDLPSEHTIRGFHHTRLNLSESEPTAAILTDVFGFEESGSDGNVKLYRTNAAIGSEVEIDTGSPANPVPGRGTIHHVAFRAKDDDELMELREKVVGYGLSPTMQIDRHWFHSVYFRSPGGVLFEIATDGPGYTVDEDADALGETLILPPWLESKREIIEKQLPEIHV